MKHRPAIVWLGILFSALSLPAQELAVSESTIDYGTIKEGPPVEKTITLTNQGSRTLAIANLTTS
jgi:hypothetical protein